MIVTSGGKKMDFDLNKPAWLEINLKALEYNYKNIKDIIKNETKIAAVVKADAYGHGAVKIAHKLADLGTDFFCVGNPDEGLELRKAGIKKPILVLAEVLNSQYEDIAAANLIQAVGSWRSISALNKFAEKNNSKIKVHLKIDTGMGRTGISPSQLINVYKKTKNLDNIIITGVFSHFARADEKSKNFSIKQLKLFKQILSKIKKSGFILPLAHIANSAAVVDFKQSNLDLIRPGIILYGLAPSSNLNKKIDLKPLLSFKTKVVDLWELPAGSPISYGSSYKTKKREKLAVLPVGYKDGYPRLLSNKGEVLIKGKRAPIRGKVCMGQTIVSVDHLNDLEIGEEVVLIGSQKNEEIKVDEIAQIAGTINYEIICNLSQSLKKLYLK